MTAVREQAPRTPPRFVVRTFRERGQTVLIVTHDPEVGASCDRIIRMRDGRIVTDESVTDERAAA